MAGPTGGGAPARAWRAEPLAAPCCRRLRSRRRGEASLTNSSLEIAPPRADKGGRELGMWGPVDGGEGNWEADLEAEEAVERDVMRRI